MTQQEPRKTGFRMATDIVRRDPFTDLRPTVDRLFDDSFRRPPARLFDEGTLPGIVYDAEVEAGLESGVLRLHIPFPEQAKSKQIAIRNGD